MVYIVPHRFTVRSLRFGSSDSSCLAASVVQVNRVAPLAKQTHHWSRPIPEFLYTGSEPAMPAFAMTRSIVLDFEVDRHCLKRATWSFHCVMSHLTKFTILEASWVSFAATTCMQTSHLPWKFGLQLLATRHVEVTYSDDCSGMVTSETWSPPAAESERAL